MASQIQPTSDRLNLMQAQQGTIHVNSGVGTLRLDIDPNSAKIVIPAADQYGAISVIPHGDLHALPVRMLAANGDTASMLQYAKKKGLEVTVNGFTGKVLAL